MFMSDQRWRSCCNCRMAKIVLITHTLDPIFLRHTHPEHKTAALTRSRRDLVQQKLRRLGVSCTLPPELSRENSFENSSQGRCAVFLRVIIRAVILRDSHRFKMLWYHGTQQKMHSGQPLIVLSDWLWLMGLLNWRVTEYQALPSSPSCCRWLYIKRILPPNLSSTPSVRPDQSS